MKLTLDIDDEMAGRLFEVAERGGERVGATATRLLHEALRPPPSSRYERMQANEAAVTKWHRERRNDSEIAKLTGLTPNGVAKIRERLRLPAVGKPGPEPTRRSA